MAPRVSVVIPTLNEAPNLHHILPRLSPRDEVLIVDGGSTDGTIDTALALRPDARIVMQDRRGKGNALPEEIPAFVQALVDGADYVKGSRYLDGGGSTDLTRLRSAGNKALSGTVNLLFGTRYTDLCYGYNAFWRSCVDDLACDADGFEIETLMNIRAARAGLTIAEIPSHEEDRLHGESNLRPFRDGMRILRLIVRERLGLGRRAEPTSVEPSARPVAGDLRAEAS